MISGMCFGFPFFLVCSLLTCTICALHCPGVVPPACVCKSDQWFLLTRAHARAVVELNDHHADLWKAFSAATASDELFFPTCLAMLGVIDLAPLHAAEAARRREVQRCELYGMKPSNPGAVALPSPGKGTWRVCDDADTYG
jgi:hypothetical protein